MKMQPTAEDAINLVLEVENSIGEYPPNCSNYLIQHRLAVIALSKEQTYKQKYKIISDASPDDLLQALSSKNLTHHHLPLLADTMLKLIDNLSWYEHLDGVQFLIDEVNHLGKNCNEAHEEIEEYLDGKYHLRRIEND